MKLYVWTDFCKDWTSGLAFAIAKDEKDARKQIVAQYGCEPSDWGNLNVYRTDRRIASYVCGGG